MFNPRVEVVFRVRAETRGGEAVFVVGNVPELGSWRPHGARRLLKESQNGSSQVWHASLPLPITQEVEYRYFIGHVFEAEDEDEERSAIVCRWETHRCPRLLNIHTSTDLVSITNGWNKNGSAISEFGQYDNQYKVDHGWLSGQSEVQLRLFNNPINMWKSRHRNYSYRIRCKTVDLRYRDMQTDFDDEESTQDIPNASQAHMAFISVLNGREDLPREQSQFGHVYAEDDYMTFKAQTFDYESTGFQFEFYVADSAAAASDVPKYAGNAFLLPVNFKVDTSKGLVNLPINGTKNIPIGDFTVEYLIVKSMQGHQCDMAVSYSTYWKHERAPLDVGHRGLGGSFGSNKPIAEVRENTIASLKQAGVHGADMVEFDVQLSKDLVPVIYHDLTVCLILKRKSEESQEMFEIPVQDLKQEQLQMLKLEHVSVRASEEEPRGPSLTDSSTQVSDTTPFPALRNVFEKLDAHLGVNIEIKYCMKLKNGDLEEGLKHFPERNRYLDIILNEVFTYAGNRRILFSCFDPDICSMIRLKQNMYPVVYLTQGASQKYDEYYDLRTRTSPIAAYFSNSHQLLGVNYHSEDLLKMPDLIQTAKDLGLVVFCWGDDNNDKKNIEFFKKSGVHGVIYDRINEFKGATKDNLYNLEHQAKVELLTNVGAIGAGSNISGHTTPESCHGNSSGHTTSESSAGNASGLATLESSAG